MSVIRKVQVRRGTAAAWSSANPVLSSGEFGYDETNDKVKIGDGTTAWNSLAFAHYKPNEVDALVQAELDSLLAAENSWADTQRFGSGTTGANNATIMEWQTAGMAFPVTFSAGLSDFGEGQIDVTWSMSMNLNGVSASHPEWSENVENFFVVSGTGQRLIEKNWAYTSIDGTVSYRPYQFGLDIDTHQAYIEHRMANMLWVRRTDLFQFFRFDMEGSLAGRFLCNGYIQSNGVASTNSNPLLALTATNSSSPPPRLAFLQSPISSGGTAFRVETSSTGSIDGYYTHSNLTAGEFTAFRGIAQSNGTNTRLVLRGGDSATSSIHLSLEGGGRAGWSLGSRYSDDHFIIYRNAESPDSVTSTNIALRISNNRDVSIPGSLSVTGASSLAGAVTITGAVTGTSAQFNNGLRIGTAYSAIDVASGAGGLYLSGAPGALNHLLINSSGHLSIGQRVGFNGTTPIAKPTVSGSRGGNAALDSLLTALANYGLITNSTSA